METRLIIAYLLIAAMAAGAIWMLRIAMRKRRKTRLIHSGRGHRNHSNPTEN